MDGLDASQIRLPGAQVRVLERCTSTNALLLESDVERPTLLACEEQTAGRGRRGRRWYSVPGRSITFSLASPVHRPLRELAALSLVAGVACVRALRALGAAPVALKWPNDLVIDAAKLGGILVETRMRGGSTLAVIGVGINYGGSRPPRGRGGRGLPFFGRFVYGAGPEDAIPAPGGGGPGGPGAFETPGV